MLVAASFRPPAEVLAALAARVREAADSVVLEPVAEARRGWLRRAPAPAVATGVRLETRADPQMLVTRFGNLTPQDYRRVLDVLHDAGTGWPPATVHVAGFRVDVESTPFTLRADLGGEVEVLDRIAREVALRAADLNLYVDRRLFRPHLVLAELDTATTAAEVDALAAGLPRSPGESWTIDHLSVLRRTFDSGDAGFVEVERVPLVACS